MQYAFLFDIDGCLTIADKTRSILDVELIDQLLDLSNPIAFVTGRSDGWLRKQYLEFNRNTYLDIPTYIEFGLAKITGDTVEVSPQGSGFLQIRQKMIDDLAKTTAKLDIYFEPNVWYDDYPDHGSLWVEDKHIQLSIAENTNISTEEVHQLCDRAWSSCSNARVLHHHLGVDAIPIGWSKAKATEQFVENLKEDDFKWYVFGDNESDKEMMQGLSNVNFISTKENASNKVRDTLQLLSLI